MPGRTIWLHRPPYFCYAKRRLSVDVHIAQTRLALKPFTIIRERLAVKGCSDIATAMQLSQKYAKDETNCACHRSPFTIRSGSAINKRTHRTLCPVNCNPITPTWRRIGETGILRTVPDHCQC